MRYLFVHGMGDYHPGWIQDFDPHSSLGADPALCQEFNYEDLMEASWVNQFLIWITRRWVTKQLGADAYDFFKLPQDHVNDVMTYFCGVNCRKKAVMNLINALQAIQDDVVIVGHSLGSFAAYEGAWHYSRLNPQHRVILLTTGSLIGRVKYLLVGKGVKPDIDYWLNLYAPLTKDPLSTRALGADENIEVPVGHDWKAYLNAAREPLTQWFHHQGIHP